ncbi:MAG: phosphoribosyltransferase [Spirochaetaceae bacterium 4572_59]|nr:MAG: phosphoribosyltransferase [Spirochaetaceae bacterium 4572_59]
MEKIYITYNQIHNTMKDLSEQVKASGFNPDLMVAIGTGGFIPARMAKTFLNIPILTVGIAYYDLDDNPTEKPTITQWMDQPDKQIRGKKVLLVDEVDDTRATIGFCLDELKKHEPAEIAICVIHNKKKKKKHEIPDWINHYFIGENLQDEWICYPWDAEDTDMQDKLSR